MWSITWVVKTSKFCNLRCAYCYEWDELSNRDRMSDETWLGLLDAAADCHDRAGQLGREPQTSIILHGGEPLTMPMAALEFYCESFESRFGSRTGNGEFRLGLQTNLHHLTEAHLQLFRSHRVSVGVSFDAVPGVRLNLGGAATEDIVRRNMGRLADGGIRFGLITVLAAHTLPYLERIYEWVTQQGLTWRVLPLFDGPDSRDTTKFAVDNVALVSGMSRLFDRWFADGASYPIDPLNDYLKTAIMELAGIRPRQYDRSLDGDGVLVVNLDGGLYRVVDGYDTLLAMGNVGTQKFDEITRSHAYHASLLRDKEEQNELCDGCSFAGPCSGWHIFEAKQSETFDGRCPIAYPLLTHIRDSLINAGFDSISLRNEMAGLIM